MPTMQPLTVNMTDALKHTTLTVRITGQRAGKIIGVGNLLIQHGETITS